MAYNCLFRTFARLPTKNCIVTTLRPASACSKCQVFYSCKNNITSAMSFKWQERQDVVWCCNSQVSVKGNLISFGTICKGRGAVRPVLARARPRAHYIFTMILKRDRADTHQQNPSATAIHNTRHNIQVPFCFTNWIGFKRYEGPDERYTWWWNNCWTLLLCGIWGFATKMCLLKCYAVYFYIFLMHFAVLL